MSRSEFCQITVHKDTYERLSEFRGEGLKSFDDVVRNGFGFPIIEKNKPGPVKNPNAKSNLKKPVKPKSQLMQILDLDVGQSIYFKLEEETHGSNVMIDRIISTCNRYKRRTGRVFERKYGLTHYTVTRRA